MKTRIVRVVLIAIATLVIPAGLVILSMTYPWFGEFVLRVMALTIAKVIVYGTLIVVIIRMLKI